MNNIDDLAYEHTKIPDQAYLKSEKHTRISLEFAISVLNDIFTTDGENINACFSLDDLFEEYRDKISELKNYLEKIK